MSAHQGSFAEVLALAEIKGTLPAEISLLGFQAAQLEFGLELSAKAKAALPNTEAMILDWLAQHSVMPRPRLPEKNDPS